MSTEMPDTGAHSKPEPASLGDLLGDVTRDMSTLMRQELELAKVELKDTAVRAGKGSAMLAGAGIAGHFVLLFLSVALWSALGTLWGLGWSGVAVALVWAIVAAVLALLGRKKLKEAKGLPQTSETLQEIPSTLKPNS
ncbi:phage holin family protein [Paeniglutamicibacter antarcticus]|uniref:Phage holin family protein n=1 Tax=Paeniglutamicibacter antarcticus TaxID=494023 RepID=A0ABP9TS68_9MICC